MHLKRNSIAYQISIILPILYGCAQIGTLSGGEKDKEPPVIVKSTPIEKSLNFSGEKIVIGFDEFIQLDNINAVFFTSPPLDEKPEFKLKRKNLVINLKQKLLDTTTYSFWFGDAIRDYHENNPLKNFKFVFSTGDVLDTFEVSGRIIDSYTHKPQPDVFVMLYNQYSDSVPLKEKPYYAVKSDTAGNFKIDYIKPGKYKLFALKDNDADFLYNLPNERIAFLDSFVFPKVETKTIIDSLKAGSIIHTGEKDAIGDTLNKDTVIIHNEYLYTPNKLTLFLFSEDLQAQYIMNKTREQRGKIILEFFKPIDSLIVEGLDFQIDKHTLLSEKTDSAKKVIYWFKDRKIYQKDTLRISVSYYNKDSLDQYYRETDTLELGFDHQLDTVSRNCEFEAFETECDSVGGYVLTLTTPIYTIHKDRIKLFGLSDTIVEDPRIQSILKAFRPEPDLIQFEIKRPFVNTFYAELSETDSLFRKSEIYRNTEKTKLEYRLTDAELISKDTLKTIVYYDNLFFRDQIQKFSDTLTLPLFKQGLIELRRPEENMLVFVFKKKLSTETSIEFLNEEVQPVTEILLQPNGEELHVNIKNTEIIEKDTLMIRIRTKDFDNVKGEKVFFEYDKLAIFNHKKQKLNQSKRTTREEFLLVFNKELIEIPKISLVDLHSESKWYEEHINSTRDTVKYIITNKDVSIHDTIHIAIIKNKEIDADTLALVYKKPPRHKPGSNRQKQDKKVSDVPIGMHKVTLETPIEFSVVQDSIFFKQIRINTVFDPRKEYLIKLDTSAIEDIFSLKSKKKETKFKVQGRSYYGDLKLNISNIKRISDIDFYLERDSVLFDSTAYSKLDSGQVLIYLKDKDEKVVYESYLKQDQTIIISKINPGDYSIQLVYDLNGNRKWDTGKYLKKQQAERILYYPKKINIKSGIIQTIDLKILNTD